MRQPHTSRVKRVLLLFLALPLVLATLARPLRTSAQTTFDYRDALEKAIWFFDANKWGPNVASSNVFPWRGSCHVNDGSQDSPALDLSGGVRRGRAPTRGFVVT